MPLKLVRRPKSPYWIIRGTLRGIRVEESTGISERRAAEEIRAKREAEILAASVYGRRATVTFASAAVSYLEHGGESRFLEPIIEYFGTTPLAKIDQDALDRAAIKLYPHYADSSRNRAFYTPAVAVITHAARRKWCERLVLERPRKGQERTRWLKLDEANRLIAACSKHLRPLVVFMLYTGARCGEALWLDWRNVDLDRRQVIFEKTKNGEARGVPLHERVVAALANLGHRDGEVFRRPDGLPYDRPDDDDPDDTSAGTRIKTAFKGACKRAEITNFTPHCCRHTWATWHYIANRDLKKLQVLGGWKTLSMVLRYVHTNVDEHTGSIDALPGEAGGKLGETKTKGEKTA
jgi:integrase